MPVRGGWYADWLYSDLVNDPNGRHLFSDVLGPGIGANESSGRALPRVGRWLPPQSVRHRLIPANFQRNVRRSFSLC